MFTLSFDAYDPSATSTTLIVRQPQGYLQCLQSDQAGAARAPLHDHYRILGRDSLLGHQDYDFVR
jgi:hypothetical protein